MAQGLSKEDTEEIDARFWATVREEQRTYHAAHATTRKHEENAHAPAAIHTPK